MRFNVLPLKRDIVDTYESLVTIRDSVKELLDREGTIQKRHYRRDLFSTLTSPNGDVSHQICPSTVGALYRDSTFGSNPYVTIDLLNYSTTAHYVTRKWITNSATFHGTLEFRYTLTPFEREHALVLGLLSKLGINFDLAIIWNALPWSFVIDWVLGVSKFLGRTRISSLDPKVTILRYCSSLRAEKSAEWTFKATGNDYYATVEKPLGATSSTAYRRRVGDPGIRNWIVNSGISLDEFGLATSLAMTR
jgi:hypothetical protein